MASSSNKPNFSSKLNLEEVYNNFLALEEKQQVLVVIGIIALIIILLFLPISCAGSKINELEKNYQKTEKQSQELASKIALYQKTNAELETLKKQLSKSNRRGSLSAVVESIAKNSSIEVRLDPKNLNENEFYVENAVDVTANKVTIEQITSFLYEVESFKDIPLRVSRLQIRTASQRKRSELNLSCQISTFKFKKGDTDE